MRLGDRGDCRRRLVIINMNNIDGEPDGCAFCFGNGVWGDRISSLPVLSSSRTRGVVALSCAVA